MGNMAHLRQPLTVTRQCISAAMLNDVAPGFLGFASGSGGQTGGSNSWAAVPLWFLALITGIAPATQLYRRLQRRHLPGHCRRCGYDLRATPGRCPECGNEAPGNA